MEALSDNNKQIAPKEGLMSSCIFPCYHVKLLDQIYFKSSNIYNATITSSSSGCVTDNPVFC